MVDGSILFDTGVKTDGMRKGVDLIKKDLNGVSSVAERTGRIIKEALNGGNVSASVSNAALKVNQLERQLAAVSEKFKTAVTLDDDKAAERLGDKQIALYDKLEVARKKLTIEAAKAARKQTEEETKEAAKQEQIALKQEKRVAKQQTALSKSVDRFGVRLRGIIGSALIFNIISSGLRSMTQYFGNALKANDDFSKALSQLKGALLTAFQPIYNAVAPALTYLVQLATMAVEAIALLFATLSGTTLEESKKAAEKLYEQANGYKAAGSAAKKAGKQIAAFDEIQKLSNQSSGGGGGSSDKDKNKPEFSFGSLPKELEAFIEKLSMNIQDIFFNWGEMKEGDIVKKIVAGLSVIGGAVVGFAIGGPAGAAIGATIGVGLTLLITSIVPETEWESYEQSVSGFFGTIEAWLTEDWDGMISSFNTAWEGFLKSDYWSGENSLGSLISSAIGIDYQEIRTTLLSYIEEGGSMWDLFRQIFNPDDNGGEGRGQGGKLGFVEKADEEKTGLKTLWDDYFVWYEGAWTTNLSSVKQINNDHYTDLQSATELIWGTIGDIINGEWDKVKETWGPVATWFDNNVIKPVSEFFATLWGDAPGQATEAWEGIKQVFNSVGKFFSDVIGNAWQAVIDVFSDGGDIFTNIQDGIAAAFKSIVNDLIDGINSVVSKPFTKINSALHTIKGIEILGIKPFSGISTISVPKIPYLAQGAVLPANKPFMAVVGDQRHGTNVEAPLTTIQEAVANVMDGQTSAILAGFEMSIGVQREILAAVLGIQIGDDAIVQAVNRYNSKMAVVRGY